MGKSSRWLLLIAPAALLLAIVVVLIVFATSQPSVSSDSTALACQQLTRVVRPETSLAR